MQRTLIVFLISLPLCFSACSNSNPQGRVAIQGSVTLAGEPLDKGSIQFESLQDLKPLILTGGVIQQGTFAVPAAQGLLPNQEYTVRIRSVQEIPGTFIQAADPEESGPEMRDVIPPQFGTASTLTVSATKKSPNVFQFDLMP